MNPFFRDKRAQSTIEMALVVVLVILGVIVTGPYVLRSINAHFKLWDDSVQDSFDDHLIQATKEQINIILPPCSCHWVAGSCGAQGCNKTERVYAKACTPSGCDLGYSCQVEDSCCSSPVRTNTCWRSPSSAPHPATGTIPAGFHACGSGALLTNVKDRVFQYVCGTGGNQQVCQQDTTTADGDRDCTPRCRTEELPVGAILCPGDGTTLTDDMSITYVSDCSGADGTQCRGVVCILTPAQDFTVAAVIANSTNNQSFSMCCAAGYAYVSSALSGSGSPGGAATLTLTCKNPSCP